MRDKTLNLKWAAKLMASKSFVLLTDKESFIAMEGIDPNRLNDMLILQAQQASIDKFIEDLQLLRKAHERRVKQLGGKVGISRKKTSNNKRNRSQRR